jgi:putative membrane protein
VLSALLRKFHDMTLLFLTGLMLGTLGKIWPWKQVISWRENSKGELVPLVEQNLSPFQFEQITGESSQMIIAIVCLLVGIGLVWGLERVGNKANS